MVWKLASAMTGHVASCRVAGRMWQLKASIYALVDMESDEFVCKVNGTIYCGIAP